MFPRKESLHLGVHEHVLLEHHGVADSHSDADAEQTRAKDKKHCLVKVKHFDPERCKADGTQHSDFLGLIKQIRCHAGNQRKEAKKHHYSNCDVEDNVDYFQNVGIALLILVSDPNLSLIRH